MAVATSLTARESSGQHVLNPCTSEEGKRDISPCQIPEKKKKR